MLWNRFWVVVKGIPGFDCWFRIQFGGTVECLGLFVVRSTGIVSNNLAIGAEQLRDKYIFCVWRSRRIFCEFPLEWGSIFGFEKVIFEIWNWVLEIILLRYAQNLDDHGCAGKICGLGFWIVLERGNVVVQIDKSLGCFRKEHPNILKQKKKKRKEKKGTRKLLRKSY